MANVFDQAREVLQQRMKDTGGGQLLASGKRVPQMSRSEKVMDYLNLGLHSFPGMGMSDELQGVLFGTAAKLRGDDYKPAYREGRDRQRDYIEAARERTGAGGTVAEIAAGMVPVAKAAQGAQAAARAVSPAMRMLRGAGAGGATGAAIGFGEGEDGAIERATNAALPGVAGAGLGAAGPLVGAGIGKMVEKGARRRAARRGRVPEATVDPLKHAFEIDMRQGQATPEASMVADTGGTATALLGETMEDIGGRIDDVALTQKGAEVPTEAAIRKRLTARSGQATDEFRRSLDATMGPAEGVMQTTANLRAAGRPGARAAYNRAYASVIDYSSEAGQDLEALLKSRRIPKEAWSKANELMAREGSETQQILANVADDGNVTFDELPDVRQIDYLKRALDDISKAENAKGGVMGGTTALGRATGKTSREMLDLVDGLAPEYGAARKMAAVPIKAKNAMESGYKALSSERITADEFADEIRGMAPEDRQWAAKGMRNAIEEMMAQAKESLVPSPTRTGYVSTKSVGAEDVQNALKRLSSDRARQKIRMVLGNEAAEGVFDSMDRTLQAYKTEASSLPNLRKQARGLLDEFAPGERSDAASKLMRGDVVGATQEAAGNVMGRALRDDQLIADAGKADLVNVLTRPTSEINVGALRAAKFPKQVGRRARMATERGMTAGAVPAAAALSPEQRKQQLIDYLLRVGG